MRQEAERGREKYMGKSEKGLVVGPRCLSDLFCIIL